MTTDEIPSDQQLKDLREFLLLHGCVVNTHNAHGEWLEITLPNNLNHILVERVKP